jgi:hypothetical protein
MSLPTFQELKQYIKSNPQATIWQITNHFNQQGEYVWSVPKPDCKKKMLIVGFNMKLDFTNHLVSFIKKDYVKVEYNHLVTMITDGQRMRDNKFEEFCPVVLSIK